MVWASSLDEAAADHQLKYRRGIFSLLSVHRKKALFRGCLLLHYSSGWEGMELSFLTS